MMDENLLRGLFCLKAYLQGRGATVAGYRKDLLSELTTTVRHCKLAIDLSKILVLLPPMLRVLHHVPKLDWIEQCFTSPPTQYRLYGRRFLQVKRPNQQYQSTEGKSYKGKNTKNIKKTENTHTHKIVYK